MAADPVKIAEKREKLEAVIAEAQKAIKSLQETCNHSGNLTYQYYGSSGNWSKSDDEYWMEWHCKDCDKRWITSQDNAWHLTQVVHPNAKPGR